VRAVYLFPNLLTSANLFCGVLAICRVLSWNGNPASPEPLLEAGWLIFLAMVLDLFDGLVARFFRATSEFGVQFDSLSDFLSFGVAPSLLVYRAFLADLGHSGRFGVGLAFLYITFVALRLARFNTQAEAGEKSDFAGLPCPLAAGLLVSTTQTLLRLEWGGVARIVIPFLGILLSILMISTVTYPALSTLQGHRKKPGIYILGVVGALIALVLLWEGALMIGFGAYIFYNLFRSLGRRMSPGREKP